MCVMEMESLTFFTSVVRLQALINTGGRHTKCLSLVGKTSAGSFMCEGTLMGGRPELWSGL